VGKRSGGSAMAQARDGGDGVLKVEDDRGSRAAWAS
jgi:hypothetical protein